MDVGALAVEGDAGASAIGEASVTGEASVIGEAMETGEGSIIVEALATGEGSVTGEGPEGDFQVAIGGSGGTAEDTGVDKVTGEIGGR